jgi:hypothetical protein
MHFLAHALKKKSIVAVQEGYITITSRNEVKVQVFNSPLNIPGREFSRKPGYLVPIVPHVRNPYFNITE